MNLTQMIEYLKETSFKTEGMGEIITHLENMNQIKPIGLFSTPTDIQDLQNYLKQLNGSEGVVANTAAFMMFNLMIKTFQARDVEPETEITEEIPAILKPQQE